MRNAVEHGAAREVQINLAFNSNNLLLTVQDNRKGFPSNANGDGWVCASCAIARNASVAHVKCNQAALTALLSSAVCRCKPMPAFSPYHDTERRSCQKVARRRTRVSSGLAMVSGN